MATSPQGGGEADRQKVAALLSQLSAMPAPRNSADRLQRGQLLDELQEAVGLADRMVTEQDILRQAKRLLGGD